MMKSPAKPCIALCLAAVTALLGATSMASPLQIQLPTETAKLKASALPGYAIAVQKCAICHSADYVHNQPPSMSLPQWTAEVGKMQHAYGAPISNTEAQQIGAYLAVAYGSAKSGDADVINASAKPTVEPAVSGQAKSSIDVKALLNENACLGCHAIDKKIVGPGYHDVALKYRGDLQALIKLQASIQKGGSGKWGSMAMPPFSSLSAEETKALAAFVLAQ